MSESEPSRQQQQQRRHDDPGFQAQIDAIRTEQAVLAEEQRNQHLQQVDQAAEQNEQEIEQTAQKQVQARQGIEQASQIEAAADMRRWSNWFVLGILIAGIVVGLVGGFILATIFAGEQGCGVSWAVGVPC